MSGGMRQGDLPIFRWKGETSGHVHSIHDRKVDSGEVGEPALLVIVHMITDGLVYGLVCVFTGDICLGVICCGHL